MSIDLSIALGVFLLLFLLICSALISGSEVALFSLTPSHLAQETTKKRQLSVLAKLLEAPKKLLATILIANNFINIAIVILFNYLCEPWFASLTPIWFKFLLEVVLVSFLILMFGEILPKIYASRNNLKFALTMAYPLKAIGFVFSPLALPMRNITVFIQNKLGKQKRNFSIDQLSQALELTSEYDTTTDEQKILKGIVSFGNVDVKQVMKPRIDIFAINIESKFSEILPEIIENGYSRIPVYQENIDQIEGVLYVKDLLPYLDETEFKWTAIIREVFFVPENKKLDDLMTEFQDKKVHLAVVVDEYGGTSGLVSLEDIIEEIVGDISDEFDDEDLIYSKLDDNNYIFEGKTPLKDFYRVLNFEAETEAFFEEHRGEAETLAGFVLEISGIFPKKNSKINFKNYVFKIEALSAKRIQRIKITVA